LEGGLAERALPETIQALLAARLDRLGPGERAVLERGAVVGKEFTTEDVVALLDPDAVPTADVHLQTLADRGFVRLGRDAMFGFRHVLVQESVYRSAPKRLRAELHERYADRLDSESPDLPDLDEFVGYHLEQAYRLRADLGESDRRTERLAEDGGARLGAAGVRAAKRGDMPASTNILTRAITLVTNRELRGGLMCELAISRRAAGDSRGSEAVLLQAISESGDANDRRIDLRARLEYEYVRLASSGTTADALLDAAAEGIPTFEAVGDERSLGRAWLLTGFALGARRGQHEARLDAAERALVHYRISHWPTSTCVGEIAQALYYGPTEVDDAIARCEELLGSEVSDRAGKANVEVFLAGLVAQDGRLAPARDLIASARRAFEDLGQWMAIASFCDVMLSELEMLADNAHEAEKILTELCAELEQVSAFSHLASRAGDLAEALYRQGRLDQAAEWVAVAETHSAADDLDARVLWMPVRAKIAAQNHSYDEALALASDALALAEASDALNRCAKVNVDLAEVHRLAGRSSDAEHVLARALALYERKGNVVDAARVRALLDDVALV
jgi:tetratricopeptide (TPR) repeat protein